MPEDREEIRVRCITCANQRTNHRVLHEIVHRWCDGPDEPVHTLKFDRFVQCMGCESPKYVRSEQDLHAEHPYDGMESVTDVFPEASISTPRREQNISQEEAKLPDDVWKMYSETVMALNARIHTLAAGGLRATVEAVCLAQGLTSGTLQKKIDELANQGLLTKSQAELLHEERYLGNAALHELETPDYQALEDGLQIVEGLLNTIYVLPIKADRLRKARGG